MISSAERSSSGKASLAPASAYQRLISSWSRSGSSAARSCSSDAVDVGVVELPRVLAEVAPAAERRMGGDRLPPVVPDRARAEHRIELRRPRGRDRSGVEAVAHADPVEVALHVPADRLRRIDAERIEDRRDEVDRVVVLVADLTARRDALRPRDDARVRRAAVELVALPHLERRVERHRPAGRVVVVGPRASELVEQGQVRLDRVRDAVGELHLVDGAVGSALAAGAVVGDHHDERVLTLSGLLQIVEQPPDLMRRRGP